MHFFLPLIRHTPGDRLYDLVVDKSPTEVFETLFNETKPHWGDDADQKKSQARADLLRLGDAPFAGVVDFVHRYYFVFPPPPSALRSILDLYYCGSVGDAIEQKKLIENGKILDVFSVYDIPKIKIEQAQKEIAAMGKIKSLAEFIYLADQFYPSVSDFRLWFYVPKIVDYHSFVKFAEFFKRFDNKEQFLDGCIEILKREKKMFSEYHIRKKTTSELSMIDSTLVNYRKFLDDYNRLFPGRLSEAAKEKMWIWFNRGFGPSFNFQDTIYLFLDYGSYPGEIMDCPVIKKMLHQISRKIATCGKINVLSGCVSNNYQSQILRQFDIQRTVFYEFLICLEKNRPPGQKIPSECLKMIFSYFFIKIR